ncbi:hypothetical protein UFOVP1518_47 [uncultured Caudovirales phage]|uniref:Uncharacterized protein n=1 Tax=uncultured Caudovirales phage TaxID=2100421 RepID=A0A6J5MI62_9CAUD|nr:hypothetical protein UFOVP475_60 [uncultured Caudovirales phage]CAB4169396.1 hypothetical protein UFOVP897_22 [uncultured Caudovirales phage]CAB4175879.1 hypothetical protein UFOVP984_60 [uncultured Caudovirales phage]CAB4181120.1 hypothetical protein UFOVP1072_13 [uncultured Caudovirales phage]CAB4191617.1 hypothetical protein UFOVP1211_59 [uncultured Caudovirales phage]
MEFFISYDIKAPSGDVLYTLDDVMLAITVTKSYGEIEYDIDGIYLSETTKINLLKSDDVWLKALGEKILKYAPDHPRFWDRLIDEYGDGPID